ncbi:MAG: RHS repeat-associated core domain-containing protein, partial [Pirellulaceae bacterium]|nr:RHS repeat-associated core domain-containing protein [Pirellulaceae bacterium]
AREYQEHDGPVDGSTLFVEYIYADGADAGIAKYVRLGQLVYPNGREVHYDYGTTGAIDDIMSRLAAIKDDDDLTVLASYKHLGTGTIVEEDYEDIEVKLSRLDSSGSMIGLDRFGRVVDQLWTDYGADPDVVLDEYTYTFDRAGNRTSRDNELHAAFDEDYTYDDLNRLATAVRADSFNQSWMLDGLGNFSAFNDDGMPQTRTADEANQIQTITGGWVTPDYDDAGNMISGPKPGDETTRVHYVYDAWNRLVEIRTDDSGESGDLIAQYEYDGQKRRIEKVVAGTSHSHYYYNRQWQMLEERFVDGGGATVASNQYVWSPRYVDSPVVRFHDGNGDGDYADAGDNVRYYTNDANYNVTATIDAATGNVVERYVYNAYGKATVYDDAWTNTAAPTTDGPLYCGYFFDAESGLYQVRNRYYDTSLSTFINRDPIGFFGGSSNLYEYVGSKPTGAIDPSGELWLYIPGEGVVWRWIWDVPIPLPYGWHFVDLDPEPPIPVPIIPPITFPPQQPTTVCELFGNSTSIGLRMTVTNDDGSVCKWIGLVDPTKNCSVTWELDSCSNLDFDMSCCFNWKTGDWRWTFGSSCTIWGPCSIYDEIIIDDGRPSGTVGTKCEFRY